MNIGMEKFCGTLIRRRGVCPYIFCVTCPIAKPDGLCRSNAALKFAKDYMETKQKLKKLFH
jgi:hypothetical protein